MAEHPPTKNFIYSLSIFLLSSLLQAIPTTLVLSQAKNNTVPIFPVYFICFRQYIEHPDSQLFIKTKIEMELKKKREGGGGDWL